MFRHAFSTGNMRAGRCHEAIQIDETSTNTTVKRAVLSFITLNVLGVKPHDDVSTVSIVEGLYCEPSGGQLCSRKIIITVRGEECGPTRVSVENGIVLSSRINDLLPPSDKDEKDSRVDRILLTPP